MSDMPIVIRKEYLTLMDGDECAAAILNAFEMWSKKKPKWIYKSGPQMQADFMGVFGLNRIGRAFKNLRERGFLLARNNPVIAADQTLQYLFQPGAILRAKAIKALKALKPQVLFKMFQTLFLKSGILEVKHESESIPESKSEIKSELDSKIISDSRERDFEPEGIDQAKFFSDDPSPMPEDVPQYLRRQVPSMAIRQQLATYSAKLGLTRYAEVMNRCANARSWEYVLKALANEPSTSPGSAPPPSPADDTTQDDSVFDSGETPALDGLPAAPKSFKDYLLPDWDAAPQPPALSASTVAPEYSNHWDVAYSQLEIQLDRNSFEAWLRDTRLVAVEGTSWQFAAKSKYAADMLEHRLHREIRRVLSDVIGCRKEEIELKFEVAGAVQHG